VIVSDKISTAESLSVVAVFAGTLAFILTWVAIIFSSHKEIIIDFSMIVAFYALILNSGATYIISKSLGKILLKRPNAVSSSSEEQKESYLSSYDVKVDLFEELVRYENYLSRLDELRRQNAISDKTYLALKEEYTKRIRSLKEKLKS
jgi:hypothetical protein